jgi:lipase maturation factor
MRMAILHLAWLQASDYWLARLLFERALGLIYLVAFAVAINQFRPLLGENGLLPAPIFLSVTSWRDTPSIFHIRYSDRLLALFAWAGALLSAAIVIGLLDVIPLVAAIPVWLVLWAVYLSIVNIGQVFYSFGWESLILEAAVLAAFLGAGATAVPFLGILMLRWLVFRLEFGAGLIKLRGDRCWRDLTCLFYHHETQPMPNPLSWFFHNLPKPLHKAEVLGNHFAQVVVPFGLFLPQPIASIAGAIIVATQSWLVLSGNFSWLNFLTIALAISAFDDRFLGHLLPFKPGAIAPLPAWFLILSVMLALLVAVLSYWPVRNLLSKRQLMNFGFNPFHFVNAYGAFGSITKVRNEIVLEGTADSVPSWEARWLEYEFKGKPGDPKRLPRQYAPYHLRLDWLMWFAAMSPPLQNPWLTAFVGKLLENDRDGLSLLAKNPFPDRPPTHVRALLYRYRFTTSQERRESGSWWSRTLVGEYLPPMRLKRAGEEAPR